MKELQWRDSMRSPKLYFVDLRLFVLLLAWVFWPRVWTLVPVLAVIAFLVVVEHKGYRPGAAVRALRRRVAGRPRAWVGRRYRRWVDYGVWGAVAVFVVGWIRAPVEAEFLYIAPVQEEAPTLVVVNAAPDVGEVAVAQVMEGSSGDGAEGQGAGEGPAGLVSSPAGASQRPRVVVRIRGQESGDSAESAQQADSWGRFLRAFEERRLQHGPGADAAEVEGETDAVAEVIEEALGGAVAEEEVVVAAARGDAELEAEVVPIWAVAGGTTLEEILGQWGEEAGVEVVMLTDRVYEIASSHRFTGEFQEAVRALLFGLGGLAYAPIGQLSNDGRVLAIYHRGPGRRAEGE